MRRIIFILCGSILLCNLSACANKYSFTSFNKAYKKAATVDEAIALCREYMDNTKKLADARYIQQEWIMISPETARQYALEKYQAEPNSKVKKYLYARTIENPYDVLRIGHELIKDDSDWPYGYLMVTASYLNAFDSVGRNDSLWNDLTEDSLCFLNLIDEWNDIRALYRYYKYQVFTGDFDGALKTADEFKHSGGTWIYDDEYARVLAQAGRFDDAREKLMELMRDDGVDSDKFEKYFHSRYAYLLYQGGLYDEIIHHVHAYDISDSLSGGDCYRMAAAFASQSNKDSALHYLNLAVNRDYSTLTPLPDDTIFAGYHSDPQWKAYMKKFEVNKKAKEEKIRQSIIPDSAKQLAPEIELTDTDGNPVSLRDYRGKVIVIQFWINWCSFSIKALPFVSDYARQYDTNAVQVLAIESPDASLNKIRNAGIFQGQKYAMQLLFAAKDPEKVFGYKGYPTFVIIDKDGYLRFREFGFLEGTTLRRIDLVVQELL